MIAGLVALAITNGVFVLLPIVASPLYVCYRGYQPPLDRDGDGAAQPRRAERRARDRVSRGGRPFRRPAPFRLRRTAPSTVTSCTAVVCVAHVVEELHRVPAPRLDVVRLKTRDDKSTVYVGLLVSESRIEAVGIPTRVFERDRSRNQAELDSYPPLRETSAGRRADMSVSRSRAIPASFVMAAALPLELTPCSSEVSPSSLSSWRSRLGTHPPSRPGAGALDAIRPCTADVTGVAKRSSGHRRRTSCRVRQEDPRHRPLQGGRPGPVGELAEARRTQSKIRGEAHGLNVIAAGAAAQASSKQLAEHADTARHLHRRQGAHVRDHGPGG